MQTENGTRGGAWPRAALAFGGAAALATAVGADLVVKDHVTTMSLWDSTARISNWDDVSPIDFIAAGAFGGNGGTVKQIEGIFWSVGSDDVANGADWSSIDFRLIFYDSPAAYQADPRNGTLSFSVDTPDNADWLTPVTTFTDPSDGMTYDLHRFTFDVQGLGIVTTAGQEHLMAIVPTGDATVDGETGMMYSTGGAGAVGFELDRWTRYFLPALGPDTLQNLGAPHDYFAYRVVLTDSPCPTDFNGDGATNVTDLLAMLAAWGPCPSPCLPDIDGGGAVNVTDLLALLAGWGPCP